MIFKYTKINNKIKLKFKRDKVTLQEVKAMIDFYLKKANIICVELVG